MSLQSTLWPFIELKLYEIRDAIKDAATYHEAMMRGQSRNTKIYRHHLHQRNFYRRLLRDYEEAANLN